MPHPLIGAYRRVIRAHEHLGDLRDIEATLSDHATEGFTIRKVNPRLITLPDGTSMLAPMREFRVPELVVDEDAAVLVGEFAYNLRAALDYLVFELAKMDSGTAPRGTQFPIDESQTRFEMHCDESLDDGVQLRGISDDHKLVIRALQPAFGCGWTRCVRNLSNPDKHERLTALTNRNTYSLVSSAIDTRAPIPDDGPLVVELELKLDGRVRAQVSLDGKTPLVPILELLADRTADTLDLSYTCFEGRCPH